MRPAKESFWTWLADIMMPGLTVPSLLLSWALAYWFGLPFIQALLLSVVFVVVVITFGAMLFGNRRAHRKTETDASSSGKVRGS